MIHPEIEYFLRDYEPETHSICIFKMDMGNSHNPKFTFTLQQEEHEYETWMLEVRGHKATQLTYDGRMPDSEVMITDDHPMLHEYTDNQCELIFSGKSKQPEKLIAELRSIDFNSFRPYKTRSDRHYILLESTSGILASGSQKLLEKYEKCLNHHGIDTDLRFIYKPTYFNGKETLPTDNMQIFLIETSFIIGKEFIFTKLNKSI